MRSVACFAVLLCFFSQFRAHATESNRPNILVIMVDDLGFGDLSSYGATDLRSPHIDRLIARGMRFNNFYANCPVCSPTRASLLTGRYPELVGVPGVIRTHSENSWGHLASDAILLPEVLKTAGYDSAMIGKWHLGLRAPNRPQDRGFDVFKGYLGDMMDDYYNHRRHGINYMRWNDQEVNPAGHATDLFTEWAQAYMRSKKESSSPFFLYLAYNAPHTPIQPPDSWIKKVRQREPRLSLQRAKLVALIEHMDDGIGRVIDTLQETGLEKNTVVLFTSDNGGQLNVGANNGATRDGKQSMYEGGLKVAAGAVWPGQIRPGSVSEDVVLTMDLFPTICQIAGARPSDEPSVDGRSCLPVLLEKKRTQEPRFVFFHRREGGNRYGGLTINAVRWKQWKLLQNSPFAPLELYNLEADPLEKTDLAATNRKMFNQLSTALRFHVQRGGAVPWQPASRRDEQPAVRID